MEWNYQREESTFEEIPVGEHRVRIANAVKAISKNENDMLVLTLDVSGYKSKLWHYVVFMPDHPEITNRNLTSIFDSFGIADGDFNLANWKGKVGACMTKQDDFGTKVRYFLSRKKQEGLPPWKEPSESGGKKKPQLEEIDEDDIPF